MVVRLVVYSFMVEVSELLYVIWMYVELFLFGVRMGTVNMVALVLLLVSVIVLVENVFMLFVVVVVKVVVEVF